MEEEEAEQEIDILEENGIYSVYGDGGLDTMRKKSPLIEEHKPMGLYVNHLSDHEEEISPASRWLRDNPYSKEDVTYS